MNHIKKILLIIIFLLLILGVGPRIYVFLEIPHSMKPVNYYDFLNSFLLILVTYKVFIDSE